MNLVEWIVWATTVTINFFLISYGVFGFELQTETRRFFAFFVLIAGYFLVKYGCIEEFYFVTIWGFILIHFFFIGKAMKKFQAMFLQYIAISAVDMMIGGMLYLFKNLSHMELNILSESLGVFVWLTVFIFSRKFRTQIHNAFLILPIRYYLLIVAIFLGAGFNSGSSLAGIRGERTQEMDNGIFIINNFVLLFLIIGSIALIRLICSWQQLQFEQEYSLRNFEAQKKYYEMLHEKSSELRHFRHDIKKHIRTLQFLCSEGRYDAVQTYTENLNGKIVDSSLVSTGNTIVDYFVNELLDEYKEDEGFTYDIVGQFPHMPISDSDLCTLFGNTIDNAREALMQCEKRRIFSLSVRRYQHTLLIRICNSAREKQGELLKTEKADHRNHGYGTENMKRVAQKYGGDINWKYENGMVAVEIVFYLSEELPLATKNDR